jgi:FkbM family methyltransferase
MSLQERSGLEPFIYQDEGGWWWPCADTQARAVILRDCAPAIKALLEHVGIDRRVIVQAGGNVGVYPVALADHFATVRTFEPDPINFACLIKNLEARDSLRRVVAHEAALGEEPGRCEPVAVDPSNCGAHRVAWGGGSTVVTTIDAMALRACDVIWGDVEGAELAMLKGAEKTIERFSPVICMEDKGLDRRFFGAPPGALKAWLEPLGYEHVADIGRDKIFRRT